MERFYSIAWLLVPIIALGGLFIPELGLLVILVMLALMVTGFLNGRYFCGNVCPHGSLFDNVLSSISRSNKIPDILKSKYLKWIFFMVFMTRFVARVYGGIVAEGALSTNLGGVFVMQYLVMPTILGASLAVIFSPRAWCSFCPMGTMASLMNNLSNLVNKLSFSRITVTDQNKCIQCGKCNTDCPMELSPYENFNDNDEFIDEKCIKCGKCVESCPVDILELK